ncbi:MAG: hypothetical protein N5P05_001361 [Chroococcopsis gigantea SAG 12.99]|nr:hypothetical protein [Chroococcopsis gigantea SAG 12.99]
MATRTLLRQQGKLFSFSDSVAVIAFPSEKFLRLIRGKTDLIESAFESVCGKKVKVHIQVTGATLVTPPPPETQPESKEEEKEKPIIPSTPENGHQRSTPPPVEKPLPQIPQKKENVNNTDAATIFAKIFEGELVLTESVGVPTQPQITITNRPDISDISEEDLPF